MVFGELFLEANQLGVGLLVAFEQVQDHPGELADVSLAVLRDLGQPNVPRVLILHNLLGKIERAQSHVTGFDVDA